MQKLEKILEEIDQEKKNAALSIRHTTGYKAGQIRMAERIEEIIRKHMNDGWIPVEEHPKKDYTTVFAVDKHDYYFVAVYDKEHGYRTNDLGADVDNIVSYCLFNPYRPERNKE